MYVRAGASNSAQAPPVYDYPPVGNAQPRNGHPPNQVPNFAPHLNVNRPPPPYVANVAANDNVNSFGNGAGDRNDNSRKSWSQMVSSSTGQGTSGTPNPSTVTNQFHCNSNDSESTTISLSQSRATSTANMLQTSAKRQSWAEMVASNDGLNSAGAVGPVVLVEGHVLTQPAADTTAPTPLHLPYMKIDKKGRFSVEPDPLAENPASLGLPHQHIYKKKKMYESNHSPDSNVSEFILVPKEFSSRQMLASQTIQAGERNQNIFRRCTAYLLKCLPWVITILVLVFVAGFIGVLVHGILRGADASIVEKTRLLQSLPTAILSQSHYTNFPKASPHDPTEFNVALERRRNIALVKVINRDLPVGTVTKVDFDQAATITKQIGLDDYCFIGALNRSLLPDMHTLVEGVVDLPTDKILASPEHSHRPIWDVIAEPVFKHDPFDFYGQPCGVVFKLRPTNDVRKAMENRCDMCQELCEPILGVMNAAIPENSVSQRQTEKKDIFYAEPHGRKMLTMVHKRCFWVYIPELHLQSMNQLNQSVDKKSTREKLIGGFYGRAGERSGHNGRIVKDPFAGVHWINVNTNTVSPFGF